MLAVADVSGSPHARLHPATATIDGGFWAQRRRHNAEVLIPDGRCQLEASGNIDNLRIAAGLTDGDYRGPVYMDSDLHKWVEAVGWEGSAAADDVIGAIAAAQDDDGYLNSCFQLTRARADRYSDLAHGHELYCGGHLIQAAVAHARVRGDTRLLDVARRYADHVHDVFGPRRREGLCGHPEIETALVELHRETQERRYLELAGLFLDRRGHGRLQPTVPFGAEYFPDHRPVREQTEIAGHAVRALYLCAGVADQYLETGEARLLEVMRAQWEDMARRKSYVTGGVGSRRHGEAFGDPYELPPDSYAETCAAIASIQFSWRMLLATGQARYADLMERTLFNGFAAGVALDEAAYFYVNPLKTEGATRERWYSCACCPPNVMRLLASLPLYLATRDAHGVQLHQYATGTIAGALRVRTDYPWRGRVEIEVTAPGTWTLSLRVPAWADGATLDGEPVRAGGYASVRREWAGADTVVLELPVRPRLTRPHPQVEAVRGRVAIERGPLVYCVEGRRPPDVAHLREVERPGVLGGIVAITAGAATAIPYALWANRGPAPMRVWL